MNGSVLDQNDPPVLTIDVDQGGLGGSHVALVHLGDLHISLFKK